MKNLPISLKINLALLFLGLIMSSSGLLIQIKYHMGNYEEIIRSKEVWGLIHPEWSLIHRISAIVFSMCVFYHVKLHWKWFKAVVKKKLIVKNKLVITLSIVFLIVAITGLLSFLVNIIRGDKLLSNSIIDIHDKIALILIVLIVLHIYSRFKWFIVMFKKLK